MKTPPGLRSRDGVSMTSSVGMDGGKVSKTMQVVNVGSIPSEKSPDRGLLGRGSEVVVD
jgi:hypothetical protein